MEGSFWSRRSGRVWYRPLIATLIRYRCHACGAHRDGSSGEPWVRCTYCETLIGFDWITWFESDAYKRQLQAAIGDPQRFARYPVLIAEADAAVARGDRKEALARLQTAAELQLELNEHMYPPRAREDAAYRAACIEGFVHFLWAQRQDAALSRLYDALMSTLRAFDYANPLPGLEKAAEAMEAVYERYYQLDPPADPDGLPQASRVRVLMTQFLGGYLQLLGPADRLRILERLYGPGSATEEGGDDVSLFVECLCPRCGLAFIAARAADELTCPGCMSRRKAPQVSLEETRLSCVSCGGEVTLAEGALEGRCPFCSTMVRRLARTGSAERAMQTALKARIVAQHGLTEDPLGDAPTGGFEVTEENRRELRLVGLVRVADWYASFLAPGRFLRLVRATFPELNEAETASALLEARRLGEREAQTPAGAAILEAARRALGSA